MSLCLYCVSLRGTAFSEAAEKISYNMARYPHQSSCADLIDSAAKGCALCQLILDALSRDCRKNHSMMPGVSLLFNLYNAKLSSPGSVRVQIVISMGAAVSQFGSLAFLIIAETIQPMNTVDCWEVVPAQKTRSTSRCISL